MGVRESLAESVAALSPGQLLHRPTHGCALRPQPTSEVGFAIRVVTSAASAARIDEDPVALPPKRSDQGLLLTDCLGIRRVHKPPARRLVIVESARGRTEPPRADTAGSVARRSGSVLG